jgi:hypothetical protein
LRECTAPFEDKQKDLGLVRRKDPLTGKREWRPLKIGF